MYSKALLRLAVKRVGYNLIGQAIINTLSGSGVGVTRA